MKNFFNLQRFATKISLTSGNDTLSNQTANRIIYALGGKDSVENYYNTSKVTIFGGAGNDTITNHSDKVKMSGGAGNDTLLNYEGNYLTLDGGAGNDWIETRESDHVTITGGKGNDSIHLYYYGLYSQFAKNTVIKYASGDGNDTIFGFDSNDTLHITSGSYSTSVKGGDYIVTVGKRKIILKDAVGSDYDKIHIKNSAGEIFTYNDWSVASGLEYNSANNVTLKGSTYLQNYGDEVYIAGSSASLETFINYGNNVTISGGKKRDSIVSGGDYVKISGGAGNDEIRSTGDYATIDGGKGNDYIDLGYTDQYGADSEKTVVQYASGDGKDTIRSSNNDYTLHITKGIYSTSVDGSDVVVKVGSGSITLQNAVGQKISIKNSKGKVTTKTFSSEGLIAEENNFISSDNLSSITENNSVGEFEFSSPEKLSQENLITYSAK